jgi:hypothetical protein
MRACQLKPSEQEKQVEIRTRIEKAKRYSALVRAMGSTLSSRVQPPQSQLSNKSVSIIKYNKPVARAILPVSTNSIQRISQVPPKHNPQLIPQSQSGTTRPRISLASGPRTAKTSQVHTNNPVAAVQPTSRVSQPTRVCNSSTSLRTAGVGRSYSPPITTQLVSTQLEKRVTSYAPYASPPPAQIRGRAHRCLVYSARRRQQRPVAAPSLLNELNTLARKFISDPVEDVLALTEVNVQKADKLIASVRFLKSKIIYR